MANCFCRTYLMDKSRVCCQPTDGVGTKLKLASKLKEHRYIGQDLLAMMNIKRLSRHFMNTKKSETK